MTLRCAFAAFALACASCASPPADVRRIPAALDADRPLDAVVPVGTEATISLVDDLDTEWTVDGQVFRAVLVSDLTAANGRVVARGGTLLYGIVRRARSSPVPELALDIPAIETSSGLAAPFEAKLKDEADVPGVDAWLTPSRRAGAAPYATGNAYYDATANRLRLPSGARLRLETTRPIHSASAPN